MNHSIQIIVSRKVTILGSYHQQTQFLGLSDSIYVPYPFL